jgi:flavin-dependent dehydrogenase
MMRVVERLEDMSPRGRLRIIQQDDGDIIVAVQSMEEGLLGIGDSVEFCSGFGGGGKSPHTRQALLALMEAIKLDNLENPSRKPSDGLWKIEEL